MIKIIVALILIALSIGNATSQYLYKSDYKMQQLRYMELDKCKNSTDCPSYSNGCYIPNFEDNIDNPTGVCNVFYICHDNDDNCYILNKEDFNEEEISDFNSAFHYPFYNITNQKKEKLIFTTCDRNSIKNHKCKTEFCFKNSDCLSNKCYLGDCETNPDNKIYICSLNYDYYQFNEVNYLITCGLAKQEKCEKDQQCFTGICDTESKLCADFREKDLLEDGKPKEGKPFFGLTSIIIISTLFIFTWVFFAYCCCMLSKRTHARLIDEIDEQ